MGKRMTHLVCCVVVLSLLYFALTTNYCSPVRVYRLVPTVLVLVLLPFIVYILITFCTGTLCPKFLSAIRELNSWWDQHLAVIHKRLKRKSHVNNTLDVTDEISFSYTPRSSTANGLRYSLPMASLCVCVCVCTNECMYVQWQGIVACDILNRVTDAQNSLLCSLLHSFILLLPPNCLPARFQCEVNHTITSTIWRPSSCIWPCHQNLFYSLISTIISIRFFLYAVNILSLSKHEDCLQSFVTQLCLWILTLFIDCLRGR